MSSSSTSSTPTSSSWSCTATLRFGRLGDPCVLLGHRREGDLALKIRACVPKISLLLLYGKISGSIRVACGTALTRHPLPLQLNPAEQYLRRLQLAHLLFGDGG